MAKHDVSFVVPERPLGKADVEFSVKKDSQVLGKLKISNGTVVWVPKNMQYGYKVNWSKFDEIMQSNGTREK